MSGEAVVAEIEIKASAMRVFEALSNPAERSKWWGHKDRFQVENMVSDLRVGGEWSMSGTGPGTKNFTIVGSYLRVDPPKLLEFSWNPDWQTDGAPSVVRFDREEANGATKVRVTHSRFSGSEASEYYRGWPLLLANLRNYVVEDL